MNFRLLPVIFLSLFLGACASAPIQLDRAQLESKTYSKIGLVAASNLAFEQSSAGADGSAYAAGGLLGALIGSAIDAGINKKRENRFAKIKDSISDFEFEGTLKDALQTELSKVPSFKSSEIIYLDEGPKENELKNPYIYGGYSLADNRRTVTVVYSLTLPQTSAESSEPFQKRYISIVSLDLDPAAKPIELDVSLAQQPEMLKSALTLGAQEAASLLANDLSVSSPKEVATMQTSLVAGGEYFINMQILSETNRRTHLKSAEKDYFQVELMAPTSILGKKKPIKK